MGTFRDLIVYRNAFKLAMDIFKLTKNFPPEEKYGLISQIRNSSRSVCSSIAEGIEKDSTRLILFPKYQTQIWKTVKHRYG